MSTRTDFTHLYTDEQDTDMIQPWHLDNEPLYDNTASKPEPMNSAEFVDNLSGLILGDLEFDEAFPDATRAVTFSDAGVLTTNDGLVVRLSDGTEFQVTVVRSR